MKNGFPLLLIFLFLQCAKEGDTSLEEVGKSGSITRFTVYNGYLYTLNPNEVLTYDLSNPDSPSLVNRLKTEYGLETIFIYDNTIFLGSTTSLYILDISNPAAPTILSKTDRQEEFFNTCDPVVVRGHYAYITLKIIENNCGTPASQSALLVYDVADKKNPQLVFTEILTQPNGLGYADNYLFVCEEGEDQLLVFDLSNPSNPIRLPDYSLPVLDPVDLIVVNNKMVLSTRTDIQVYDISNLPFVSKIGSLLK